MARSLTEDTSEHPANYHGREYIIAFPDCQACFAAKALYVVESRHPGCYVRLCPVVGRRAGLCQDGDNAGPSAGFRDGGLLRGSSEVCKGWRVEAMPAGSSGDRRLENSG